ncbi:MAG: class I adenylate-forming enzyme family protein [Chloroflexota bacterium]
MGTMQGRSCREQAMRRTECRRSTRSIFSLVSTPIVNDFPGLPAQAPNQAEPIHRNGWAIRRAPQQGCHGIRGRASQHRINAPHARHRAMRDNRENAALDRATDACRVVKRRGMEQQAGMGEARPYPAVAPTVPDALALHAERSPDAPALMSETRTVSWADLHDATSGLARELRGLGVGQADRVAFLCRTPMPLDDLVTALGMMSACAVVMVDAALPLPARRRIIERLRPLAIVSPTDRDSSGLAIPCWTVAGGSGLSGANPIPGRTRALSQGPVSSDTALVLSSSGTTAEPKLIPIRHESLMLIAALITGHFGLTAADRMLHHFPAHSAPLGFSAIPLHAGGVTLIPERATASGFPAATISASFAPTWTAATPARLASLGDHLAGSAVSLRFAISIGAAATDANIVSINRGLGVPVADLYGSTEAFGVAIDGAITSQMRIADDRGESPPPGESGEFQATGPMVFSGYLDDPALNADAFTADGWFRTGDLGRIEPDGRLSVLGRLTEQINRGGLKIAPLEIEAAMLAHPNVAEAAAFAIPHPTLGQEAGLAIVTHPGAAISQREIRRWLLERLPAAKLPRSIITLDALPLTATGTVRRRDLAAMAAGAGPASGG